jgi:hypothetical protein
LPIHTNDTERQASNEMKTSLLLLSFIITSSFAFAQPHAKQVNNYFMSVRKSKNTSIAGNLLTDRINENNILSSVIPYTNDSLNEIRYAAYSLIAAIGQKSISISFRQRIVTSLTSGWRDKDSGINGLVGSALQQFKQPDFTNPARDSLRTLVQIIPPYYDKLVKLCGSLNMTDQITIIQSQIQFNTIKSKSDKWSAYLALCRMGNAQAITYVMTRVKKLGVNDDVVYEVFPDLVYTRQREAIAYIVESLNSDAKNCESPNPEMSEAIPCAYRIMEYLAPIIKDFPLKTDATGDLAVPDYKTALAQARSWFSSHPNYEIIVD